MDRNSKLTAELQDRLQGAAQLDARDVADLLSRNSLTIEDLMLALLPLAAERARAPVSQFRVGAVALGMPPANAVGGPGALYLGANLEFAGLPLSMTVHAEQAAVNNAWLHDEPGLQAIAVTAAPCGHCRQFLNELCTAAKLRVLVVRAKQPKVTWSSTPLIRLLPRPFGPGDLGLKGGLMSPGRAPATVKDDDLDSAAFAAAHLSYAPYTGNHAGVALRTSTGHIVVGRAAENAAYNPTLPALQSALSSLALQTAAESPLRLEQVRLVEVPTAVNQRAMSELVLASVAIGMNLQYVPTSVTWVPDVASSG
jgi:cytidine deaminase